MRAISPRWLFISLAALLGFRPIVSNPRETREQAGIDFLINTVETSQAVVFIRNGSQRGGKAAA